MTNENPNYQLNYDLESRTTYAGANMPAEFPDVVANTEQKTNPSRNPSRLETDLMSERSTSASEAEVQNPLKKKSSLGKQVLMYGAIGTGVAGALIIGYSIWFAKMLESNFGFY